MRIAKVCFPALLSAVLLSSLSFAATPDRISGALSAANSVSLRGNVQRNAQPLFDRGTVSPNLRFGSIMLQTVPSPSQQKAINKLLADQQDHRSPYYHQWLTPEQWADRFGLSPNDTAKIKAWLQSQGFTNIYVARGRNWFMFSGSAAQVQRAFGTEIHGYDVKGEWHVANASSPKVPAALAGIVTQITGLDDFFLKPRARLRPQYFDPTPAPGFTVLAPGDIATLYDINTLYGGGIDGTGQLLAVIGQTDVYQSDLNDFRTAFGLPTITCTTKAAAPGDIITACSDPHFQYVVPTGITDPGTTSAGDLAEADLDLEWSAAVAKGAEVIYVNAPISGNTGGVFPAWHFAVDNNLASVISLSYGNCEFNFPYSVAGSADETTLQQANAQGQTFINSSGDTGPYECNGNTTAVTGNLAQNGVAVSYPASSPEVTGVGGTSISIANLNNTTFFGTTNGTDGGSAKGPVPQDAWNDTEEFGNFCQANPTNTFCTGNGITDTQTAQGVVGLSASGGGPSNCATQNAGLTACVTGFPQPTYQVGITLSGQTAARFTPDVAMMASANFPGYFFCTPLSELGDTGTGSACANGVNSALALTNPPIIGGTSAAAPVFAGVVILLNQYLAGANAPGLGNINPMLYTLAATPSNGAFNPVSTLDNELYCQPGTPGPPQPTSYDCPPVVPPGTATLFGFLASNKDATTGYNLVTGLGTVDANKLALAWAGTRATSTTSLSANPTTVNQGGQVTLNATVSPVTALGNVAFFVNGGTAAIGTQALNGTTGVATFATTALPAGTDTVTATYNGDGNNNPSTSSGVTVTVTASNFSLGANPASSSVAAGNTSGASTVTLTPQAGFNSMTTFSCPSAPTGITCAFNPPSVTPADGVTPQTTSLTISTAANMATGATPITVSATGGGKTNTTTYTLTVTATTQTFTLASDASTYTVTQGSSATVKITPSSATGYTLPITYTCSEQSTLTESTCTGPTGPQSASAQVSFTITTTAPSAKLIRPFDRGSRIFYAALLPGLLGIVFVAGSRKRSMQGMRVLGLIMILGASSLWMGSCSSNNSTQKNPGTPKGSYTVTINGSSGGASPITASQQVTLTVQ